MKKTALAITAAAMIPSGSEARSAARHQISQLIHETIRECSEEVIHISNDEDKSRIILRHNDEDHTCPNRKEVMSHTVEGCSIKKIECSKLTRKAARKCSQFYVDIVCRKPGDNTPPAHIKNHKE